MFSFTLVPKRMEPCRTRPISRRSDHDGHALARRDSERDLAEGFTLFVAEGDAVENDLAAQAARLDGVRGVSDLGLPVEDLRNPPRADRRLRKLCRELREVADG